MKAGMDAIEFIKRDTKRIRTEPRRRAELGLVLALLTVGAGLAYRRLVIGFDSPLSIGTLIVLVVLLASLPWLYRTRRAFFWTTAALMLAVSSHWLGGPLTSFASMGELWHDAGTCFLWGILATVVTAVAVATFVGRLMPAPTRAAQIAASVIPGLAGIVLLATTCHSHDLGHIAFGHWGPGLAFFPLSWLVVRGVVRSALPPGAAPHVP